MTSFWRKEPVAILSTVTTVLVAVQEYLSANQNVSWRALVPVAMGAVIRQFVYAPANVPTQGDHAAP